MNSGDIVNLIIALAGESKWQKICWVVRGVKGEDTRLEALETEFGFHRSVAKLVLSAVHYSWETGYEWPDVTHPRKWVDWK